MINNPAVKKWVEESARLCQPDRIHWCDGSLEEKRSLFQECVQSGELEELNPEKLPGCYLHRSDPDDVARTEHLTYICSESKEEAGPNNNWMPPQEAYRRLSAIFQGSMRGRVLYVVPFLMGPEGSPSTRAGVQITDSRYVVLSMGIMTRMGRPAINGLESAAGFTRCLHGKADLDIRRRFICHFPQDNTVWSVGSGYGGNALLGKKCMALRIAGVLGRKEGWMAEHMLILGLENPEGRVHYISAAFPSACGKTNLAMLVPPEALKGYKVWTVGDDIAWLRIGADGRLWAMNPEAGFFGVAPWTSTRTNPHMMRTIAKDTIYTNVAKKPDGTVWWEGHDDPPSSGMLDWRGRPWQPGSPEKAAHPNSRFTAPASRCPSLSSEWENPAGVPLSAIIFGGRRARVAPLVYESFDWPHGVFIGASTASETTAAQQSQAAGVLRRDPMAMWPFCGYNMADYFRHWLEMGRRLSHPPKIFHVNWFRTDENGQFLWPGFRENLRVLLWIVDRALGKAPGVETAIGYVPRASDLNTEGLALKPGVLSALLGVHPEKWKQELESLNGFFAQFGGRFPQELKKEAAALASRLA